MQRRASLVQGLCATFALSQLVIAGCAQPASGGGSGGSNGNGGSTSSGNGGSNNSGGSNGARGGSNGSGNGGSNGTGNGGSIGTGQGGSNTGTGGSHTGGSNGSGNGGSNTGAGGSSSGNGGSGTGTGGSSTGLAGNSGNRACGAPASGDVIADFEEGTNQNVMQGGRQGWWSAFGDTTGTQTPAAGTTAPAAAAAVTGGAPTGDTCDMFAVHSTGTGHTGTSAYVGFGASFNAVLPPPASGSTSKTRSAYDVSAYDGISFNIKSGSGTAPPVWFELQDTENVPAPDGTAKYTGVDQYNTRGHLITGIMGSWTKVFIPFATLAPRYLPNLTESDCSNASVICQAPPWDAKNALGLQFGIYPQFAVQPYTSSSSLNYDLWVDDVALYKGDDGLGKLDNGGTTMFADKTYAGCTKPAGASGKYLIPMYNKWKSTFVASGPTRIIRPENGNDTVSEGIGYGMLIAVYVGDKTLFDQLWAYGKDSSRRASGTSILMNWCIPAGGGSCSASGGSATDADEDIAFALLQAGKLWGGTYAADAATVIGDIWAHDIDKSSMLPTGGSNYATTSSSPTNPSYFAPAFYKAFAAVDSGHGWNTVATNVYTALSSIAGKASKAGLVPAWCGSNCSTVSSNGGADDSVYQYDAHRVPWRYGIDACWNSSTSGKTFLQNNATFFSGLAAGGIGRIVDIYTLGGTPNGDAQPNSMSIIGTAGVGAMAAGNAAFASAAWQFLLDASYSPASFIKDTGGKIAYTYFNATVGLLSALTLSGNFYPM